MHCSPQFAGRDLRALLALLRRKTPSGNVPSHTRLVLQALSSMAYHEGPTAFFDFSDPAAGIMRTSNLKFPSTRGYSFATWLRLEDLKHDPAEAGRAVFALLSRSVDSTKGIVVAMKGGLPSVCCVEANQLRAPEGPRNSYAHHTSSESDWYHSRSESINIA